MPETEKSGPKAALFSLLPCPFPAIYGKMKLLNGAPPEAGRARPNQDFRGDAHDDGRSRAVFP